MSTVDEVHMLKVIYICIFVAIVAAALPIMGLFVPPRRTGIRYLTAQLHKRGINARNFSDKCITELVDMTISTEKLIGDIKRRNWKTEFLKSIETTADIVYCICLGTEGFSAEELRTEFTVNPVLDILARHDPAKFGPDHLERTQLANSLLVTSRAA